MKTGGYDTPMLRALILFLGIAGAAAGANRDIYMYQGADRESRLVAGARQEGRVVLYSTMGVQDVRALAAAFEEKYSVKLVHWRGSGEKIVQRALAEARAGRDSADVFEGSLPRIEALHRQNLLEDFYTPAFAELPRIAFLRGQRQYAATRFTLFVLGYNTQLVKPAELPSSYEDLLDPRWSGQLAMASTDVLWFAALVKAMGEEKGLAYFRRLAAMRLQLRRGHLRTAQLVASGGAALAIDAYNNNMDRLKKEGAPVGWKLLAPTLAQAHAAGVARHSRRPHAALLFTEFLLSREGQQLLKNMDRIPASRAVNTPLSALPYQIIDPELALDEGEKWRRLWSELFLDGKPVERAE